MRTIPTLIIIVFFLINCTENELKRKKFKEGIIEAHFINDSILNGDVSFYDFDNHLVARGKYINGVKTGPTLLYSVNGKIKDSINYSNGLMHGKSYKFDTSGNLILIRSNYYGLEVGDFIYYDQGKIKKYQFLDLDKNIRAECTYDEEGRCDSFYFNAQPIISNISNDKKSPLINLLIYFPNPPGFETKYTLDLFDSNNLRQKTILIKSDKFIIDTVLQKLPPSCVISLAIDYRNIDNDSIVNAYHKEFKF